MKQKRERTMQRKWMVFLQAATDTLLLGLLAIVCSLPVVTLGASAIAFYGVGIGLQNGTVDTPYRTFFALLRKNFRRSLPLWLVLLFLSLLLAANTVFYYYMAGNGAVWAEFGLGVCAVVALLISGIGSFLFPMLSQNDELGGLDAVKLSFYAAVTHLGWWILKFVIQTIVFVLCWFVPFLAVFAPGLLLFCNAWIARHVLDAFPDIFMMKKQK